VKIFSCCYLEVTPSHGKSSSISPWLDQRGITIELVKFRTWFWCFANSRDKLQGTYEYGTQVVVVVVVVIDPRRGNLSLIS